MSIVRRYVSAKNFLPHRGFLIWILYETNPFLKKCPLEGSVHYRDVRYREVSLYNEQKFPVGNRSQENFQTKLEGCYKSGQTD